MREYHLLARPLPRERKKQPASASAGNGAASPHLSRLTAPLGGPVVQRWGETTDAGPASGISYEAAPSASVVSPCSGRVAFAGPFRSYRRLLILECGHGYDAVLAGLDRLIVRPGVTVQAKEPVGIMPPQDPHRPSEHHRLYFELRRDGRPIDPGPILLGKG
ncbi:MAG: peptidoglycan DD-metalloendopeptidase family protein [Acetobacteraceae bacterium]|nr:peptidoglycan DD-metalloendopeptidase family protein [Acetobacteraceae bacterium]